MRNVNPRLRVGPPPFVNGSPLPADGPRVVAHRGPTLVHRDMRINGTRGPCVIVVTVPVGWLTRAMSVGRQAVVVTFKARMFAGRGWRRRRAVFACASTGGLMTTNRGVGNTMAVRRVRGRRGALGCKTGTCHPCAANEHQGEKIGLHVPIIGAHPSRLNWRCRPAAGAAPPSWAWAHCRRPRPWSAARARR
jgi:hypothetical protein